MYTNSSNMRTKRIVNCQLSIKSLSRLLVLSNSEVAEKFHMTCPVAYQSQC